MSEFASAYNSKARFWWRKLTVHSECIMVCYVSP